MDKFQNKYRIPSTRLQNWDYRWPGAYFITICTKTREHFLGEITDGKMRLSGSGILADVFWHEIKNHAKNVELGEFVLMPNHIHGILILTGKNGNVDDNGNGNGTGNVETLHATSLPKPQQKNETVSKISPKSSSVSTIIRSYKAAVTKHAHRLGFAIEWQERFYDHIIRNDAEYQRISEYITNNPQNWESDKFHK